MVIEEVIVVLLLVHFRLSSGQPTCANPESAANTTCPFGSQCWDEILTGKPTINVWSLHRTHEVPSESIRWLQWYLIDKYFNDNAHYVRPFAQQPAKVVQDGELVHFTTDCSFQRDPNLEIWKVTDLKAFEECSLSGATLVGRVAGPQPNGVPIPAGHTQTLNVTSHVVDGANYFIAKRQDGGGDTTIPTNCEQGARLLIYKSDFRCGAYPAQPCSGRAPCVFGHGHVNETLVGFTCACPGGYLGDECENIDECLGADCGDPVNEGVCVDGDCLFTCECTPIRSGPNCQTVVPFTDADVGCHPNPCREGALCIVRQSNGELRCECRFGFEGVFCQVNVDECASNPCENGGTCVDGVAEYTCTCPCGFTGDHCETNIDECVPMPSPCLSGAACVDGDNAVTCGCSSPWTGDFCQIHENDCLRNKCQNGATCVDGDSSYTCSCQPGFTGTHCETDINECESKPCQNGATCVDRVNGFICECIFGFIGTLCETNIDECASNPCQNGATCNDGIASYDCACAPGFTGVRCETNINECESGPCQNGGTCNDMINMYTCSCRAGFTGTRCETDINECESKPCQNGATCVDRVDGFICECVFGFVGTLCETNVDECASNPCQNGATCNDGIARYDCACAPGFTGVRCETNINECESGPCQNGGTCNDMINMYTCSCRPGFTGTRCETSINECESKPCQNGATCVDRVNGFRCECIFGFIGTLCETNVDECASNPCQNGATCNDVIARYDCACAPGFTGVHCETNLGCDLNPCMNDGVCVDGDASFTCYCAAGYVGVACTVRNGNPIVSDPEAGANTTCPDGRLCWDEGRTGGHITYVWSLYKTGDAVSAFSMTLFGRLRDLWNQGGGACVQPFSQQPLLFIQNGERVNFETDCTFQKNPDLEVYKVPNIEAYESCDISGATLVGRVAGEHPVGNAPPKPGHFFALDVSSTLTSGTNYYISVHAGGAGDPSLPGNCQQGARLIVYQADFTCGSNRNVPCNDRAPCSFDLHDSLHYQCECPPGYLGDLCQNIDECLDMTNCGDPLTEGLCVDGNGEYACDCFPSRRGKEGKTCHEVVEFSIRGYPVLGCDNSLCRNGGTCNERSGGFFRCECRFGFDGDFCLGNINECASNPCQNGGMCMDGVGGYTCLCSCGFTGDECQTNVDECDPNVCQFGGTCTDGDNAVTCDCATDWTGGFCHIRKDDCFQHKCRNCAACIDGDGDYTCRCALGYTGDFCETELNECESMPCMNGGTCNDLVNMFMCHCVAGFTGVQCQTNMNECRARTAARVMTA